MNKFKKPECELNVGDNIYMLLGSASKALKRAGYKEKADEMFTRVKSAKSYSDACLIIDEYVDAL